MSARRGNAAVLIKTRSSAFEYLPNLSGFPRHAHKLGASRRKVAVATANLDIFWFKDESLEGSANLPDRNVIVAEIDSLSPNR
jgi:hypothetical protein